MRTNTVIAFSVVACLAVPGFAAAPQDSSCAQRHRGEKMAKELGLSTQQMAKLKELREEMRTVHKEHMEKMKAIRDKSKEELLKPVPSKDALYVFAKESGELSRTMAERQADHLLKVKTVLTPEQFTKLLGKDFPFPMGPGPRGPHDGKQPPERFPHEKGPHAGPQGIGPQEGSPPPEMDE